MSPIHIGFVGLSNQGWASTMLATPLFQPPLSTQYTLAAVSTTNPTSAAASAEKYGKLSGSAAIKAYHGPTTAIASNPDIDVVAIAVKAPSHKAAVMPVIEAGKDLFIEWPVGKNLTETLEIANAAKAKGIRTMVGLQGRHSPVLKKIKSIIDSGEIGRVMSTTATGRPYAELFAWGPRIAKGGEYTADATNGVTLLDIVVGHFMSSFIFALGPFASLSAVLANQHPTAALVDATSGGTPTGEIITQTTPQQIAVAGTLKNGAVASLHWRGGLETRPGKAGTPFMWTIDGEKGSIRVESDSPAGCFINISEPTLFLNGEEVKVEDPGDGLTNVGRAWAEFAKAEGNYATLEDAVEVRKALDAIVRSAVQGKRIDL